MLSEYITQIGILVPLEIHGCDLSWTQGTVTQVCHTTLVSITVPCWTKPSSSTACCTAAAFCLVCLNSLLPPPINFPVGSYLFEIQIWSGILVPLFLPSFMEQAFIDPPWTFPHSLICVCKHTFRLWLYLDWISELDRGPAQPFTWARFTINARQASLAVSCISHRNDQNDKIGQAAVRFYAKGQSLDVICSGNEIWHKPYLAFHHVEQLNGTYFNTAAWEYKHRKIRPLE